MEADKFLPLFFLVHDVKCSSSWYPREIFSRYFSVDYFHCKLNTTSDVLSLDKIC